MWIHINVDLNWNGVYNNRTRVEHWVKVMQYIKEIVSFVKPKKYFHLYEPNPDLFIAMDVGKLQLAKVKVGVKVIKSKAIKKAIVETNTKDEIGYGYGHNSYAVTFYQASTDYAIWKALSGEYKEGYDNVDEAKLIHCFFNCLGLTQAQELKKYFYCAIHRGAKFINYTDGMSWQRYYIRQKTKIDLEFEKVD